MEEFDKYGRGGTQDLDALLDEVKELLGQPAGAARKTESSPASSGKAPISADEVRINYGEFYDDFPEEQDEQEEPVMLTAYEKSKMAYQSSVRAALAEKKEAEKQERERRRLQQEAEDEQRMARLEQQRKAKKRKKPSGQDEAYSRWLYEQGSGRPSASAQEKKPGPDPGKKKKPEQPEKKKRGRVFRIVLAVLALLAAGGAFAHFIWAQAPAAGGSRERKPDVCTILLAGTDEEGYRTDTMMLAQIDRAGRQIHLVSVPRDTLVYCEYSVPKLNSAYGWASGATAGMEQLMERMTEIIGFRPDGCVVVDLDVFEELVNLMGGVDFDVPMQMDYDDPSQGLSIHLPAGEQHLNGTDALGVVRFRSGYADADLGRIGVQREFVRSALEQWVSVRGVWMLPRAMSLIAKRTQTDLSTGNLLWLAESVLLCRQDVSMQTLPGSADYIAGGSYYVLDSAGVLQTVNDCLNPYTEKITEWDLSIRVG